MPFFFHMGLCRHGLRAKASGSRLDSTLDLRMGIEPLIRTTWIGSPAMAPHPAQVPVSAGSPRAASRSRVDRPAGIEDHLAGSRSLLSGVVDRSGSGMSAVEGRVEADAAMVALRRAVDAGWRNASRARKDSDLDPIRSRPEFRLLMLDLEFPADTFAHQTTPGGK